MRIISRDGLPWVVHSRAGISVGFNTIAVLTAPVSPHEREVCCLSVPEVSRIDQSVAHREVYLPRATCSRHLGELVERSWGGRQAKCGDQEWKLRSIYKLLHLL
jgi:hypothetical protein